VYNVNLHVLQFVNEHSFEKLFEFEIENRKGFFYPPFSRLIQIIFKHKEQHIAEEAASIMLQGLKGSFGNYISGPAEPLVNKVRGQFIWELLLKLPKDSPFIDRCKQAINQQVIIIQTNKRYRQVNIIPDVDPV